MNNMAASEKAWPRTVEFFKKHLEKSMMMMPSDDAPVARLASLDFDSGGGCEMGACGMDVPATEVAAAEHHH
jgi:hypothetical protein